MGLTRSREPAAWSLRHPHTNVSAGVLGGDLPLALGLVQPGHSPGFSLMWPTKLCPRPPCHPAALGRRWGCFPSAWFTCPFPPSPRMTRVDLKNYLEHIYSVPVASVRTRVQHGGCLGWAAPCRMCGPPPPVTWATPLCATDRHHPRGHSVGLLLGTGGSRGTGCSGDFRGHTPLGAEPVGWPHRPLNTAHAFLSP